MHVATPDGRRSITACAVIDASGTWGTPNPLGGDGYLADGEARTLTGSATGSRT